MGLLCPGLQEFAEAGPALLHLLAPVMQDPEKATVCRCLLRLTPEWQNTMRKSWWTRSSGTLARTCVGGCCLHAGTFEGSSSRHLSAQVRPLLHRLVVPGAKTRLLSGRANPSPPHKAPRNLLACHWGPGASGAHSWSLRLRQANGPSCTPYQLGCAPLTPTLWRSCLHCQAAHVTLAPASCRRFQLTRDALLQVLGHRTLLEDRSTEMLQQKIALRATYVTPCNLIQVGCWQR